MTIRKYYQVLCDGCRSGMQVFLSYPSYKEIKDGGIIISKGKHYCNEECKCKGGSD